MKHKNEQIEKDMAELNQLGKGVAKAALPMAGVVGGFFATWLGFVGCMWISGLAVAGAGLAFLIWIAVTVLQSMGVL